MPAAHRRGRRTHGKGGRPIVTPAALVPAGVGLVPLTALAIVENFYAFVVDPRGGSWELLHEDVYPLRRVAGGPLPGPLRVSDPAQPDVLRAELRGSALALFVNGASVGTYDTRGYHLEGDLGLYVEALDEPKPHVHFDRFTVTPT
jgi:hypothetical protein